LLEEFPIGVMLWKGETLTLAFVGSERRIVLLNSFIAPPFRVLERMSRAEKLYTCARVELCELYGMVGVRNY